MPMTSPAMMAPTSPVTMIATMAATMAAMMLPSVAPTLWRHHRHLRAMQVPRAGGRTALFAAGYAGVWAAIGVALFAASATLNPTRMAAGAVVLCSGALQRSRWKARQLRRCREACVEARAVQRSVATAWRDGCRLGRDCALSCAAPMAVLFVAGLMDARVMVLTTVAITAERVAPAGVRVARLTGALALAAGLVTCVRAMGS